MAYNLKPRTSNENFLALIGNNPNAKEMEPVTRKEAFMADIAANGGGGGGGGADALVLSVTVNDDNAYLSESFNTIKEAIDSNKAVYVNSPSDGPLASLTSYIGKWSVTGYSLPSDPDDEYAVWTVYVALGDFMTGFQTYNPAEPPYYNYS